MSNVLIHGDCLEMLKDLPDNSIDAIVTDPPYGLSFMGKKWDYDVPSVAIWKECLRVLKPGGHVLSFGGTRTYHRMVVNIEDAGFEIRDQVQWIYGSGFPKSHDVSKGIDKAAGADREIIGKKSTYREPQSPNGWDCTNRAEFETAPSTEAAKQWQGWGTALKPANEPICLARKPLIGTVASNVQEFGTGAINIDASRIATTDVIASVPNQNIKGAAFKSDNSAKNRDTTFTQSPQGRWPANVLFDESAAEFLDEQSGDCKSRGAYKNFKPTAKGIFNAGVPEDPNKYANESGGASRFFYVAKASKRERNAGLEFKDEPLTKHDARPQDWENADWKSRGGNHHPTVKPIKLMEYLVRMVTPPGGVVLDPFMGSGTTGIAAKNLGFDFIGIEREAEYIAIAEKRIG